MGVQNLSVLECGNGEREPVLEEPDTGLSVPCYLQEGMVISTRDVAAGDGQLSHLEEQELWEIERRQLEKELYECTRAHKMSIVQNAYEMSKFQVSFGLVKRQESLAKEQLEDALIVIKKLQTEVERLNGQLRHTETENRKLTTALSSLRSELDRQAAKGENLLHSEPEAAKRISTNNKSVVKSVDVVKILTEETAPLIAQHELQTKQLQKIENNMETGEGLVTDQNVLEKWTVENEALHSATMQIEELKQRLAMSERLDAALTTSKQGLEKVTKEKEELLMRLEAATKELLECKKRIAETEMYDGEQVRYSQVIDGLNLEKITLVGQLELVRGELEKQKEAARKAQIEANKALEAERECAKAFKLVEEKEEELEYYIRQLESLREKNSMLRTQLDMEQQCKEVEMAGMPKLHEQAMNQLSRNLNSSMELVASNSVQNPQKIPLEPTSLHAQGAVSTAPKPHKSSNDDSNHKPLQDASREGKGRPATEGPDEMPNPELDVIQQQAKPTVKKSLRLRNRANAQQSMDSGSATTRAIKKVVDLTEEENDEDDGVIEDVKQSKKRSISRPKRPPVPTSNEAETSKKKGRKKYLNARGTDAELGPAHLLVKRSDGRVDPRPTPLRSNVTPRRGSRLPR